ncbi:MAG: GNAT family N-acetyltransferase [Gaiellaceae bacterium]
MSTELHYGPLDPHELTRVGEIDRTERIDAIYMQRGTRLELQEGDWSSPPWDSEGDGEYSVAAVRAALEDWAARGATAQGAFEGDRLIGLGVVLPHLRPGVSQLAFLYVSDGDRGRGIGSRLARELEDLARTAGDVAIVVSATRSQNTVRFYRRRGFEPMAEPFAELHELEPEDVHMQKSL